MKVGDVREIDPLKVKHRPTIQNRAQMIEGE